MVLHLVVNSHINNKQVAFPHLLESLQPSDTIKVIVVSGGYPAYRKYEESGITYVEADHNSIDYTGLITILEHESDFDPMDHFFYIHDTCRAGPKFYENLNTIVSTIPSNKTLSLRFPSMNMGLYSMNILRSLKSQILQFKNTDYSDAALQKFKGLGVGYEDFVFKRSPGHLILRTEITTSEPHDYYKTGVMRKVEYYKELDLYKIKANWCMKPVWELNA